MKVGVAFVLACAIATVGTAAVAAAERNHYTIHAVLDATNDRLALTTRVRFENRSAIDLTNAEFVLPQGARSRVYDLSAWVGDSPAPFTREGSHLSVAVPRLSPGASAEVLLRYQVAIPRGGGLRLGSTDGLVALGFWQALLYPLDTHGWRRARFIDVGDALTVEASRVDLTVEAPPDRTIVVPGTVQSRMPGRVTTRLEYARDIAAVIATRYTRVDGRGGGMDITAWTLPENAASGRAYIATATEFADWLHSRVGIAPSGPLHIAEVGSPATQSGQEFSGIVFIGRGAGQIGVGPGSSLDYLVAHEVAHEWHYSLVGSDQVREPWVDEALATFLAERFFIERHPLVGAARWRAFLARVQAEETRFGARPVDSTIYDFEADGSPYFATVYRRGALYLDRVRQHLGDDVFWAALSSYTRTHQNGLATGATLLATLERYGGPETIHLRQGFFRDAARGSPDDRIFTAAGRFTVSNRDGVSLLSEFERLGGIEALGYPISGRFILDGFTVQAFQKAILQWRPEHGRVAFVNVLDRLSEAGRDDWLLVHRMTPRPTDPSPDTGLSWADVVARRIAFLDVDARLRARYFSVADHIDRYGLPVATAQTEHAIVVRCQRAVLQLWKVDVPWARAGEITIANAGDLAREAGLLTEKDPPPEAA